jgi:hypothetical protein
MEYHINGVDTAFVSSDQTVVGSIRPRARQVTPPGAPILLDIIELIPKFFTQQAELKHNQDNPRIDLGEK